MNQQPDQESTYKDVLSVLSRDLYKEFKQNLDDPVRYPPWSNALQTVSYNKDPSPVYDTGSLPLSAQQLDEILNLTHNQFGAIYQNYLVFNVQQHIAASSGLLIFVEEDQLQAMLQVIYPNNRLSPAELSTLKQILCGKSLRDAASIDSVGYETKRSQFKSMCNKIGLRSQSEIVTYTITRLLVGDIRVDSRQAPHQHIRDYHKKFLPANSRLHIMVGESDAHHRVIDMGPINGKTLICLHPQIFPGFRDQDIEVLNKRNIRLLWPLRQGQISPHDAIFEFADHLNHYKQTIDLARSLQLNPDKANLVALVSGGFYGIEYALDQKAVSSLVFVGASYNSRASDSIADKFRHGIIKLATSNMPVTRKLMHFIGKKFLDRAEMSKFLLNLYSDCQADLDVLDTEFSSEQTFTAIQQRFVGSENSIVHDFYAHTSPNWSHLQKLHCKFAFIHGQLDPAHSIDDIASLANTWNAPLHKIEGKGQLLYYDNLDLLLEQITSVLVDFGECQSEH